MDTLTVDEVLIVAVVVDADGVAIRLDGRQHLLQDLHPAKVGRQPRVALLVMEELQWSFFLTEMCSRLFEGKMHWSCFLGLWPMARP